MFSRAEFVEEWNQIISFKIKESDLTKPTETFVFNALISYLRMFNYNIAPMIQIKNSENTNERRSFLIRFCNYIDHIYKISDKSHCFLYYDLQHPSPKKTIHMLNHLLNYLLYYNMFKENIVPLASGKIRQREELNDKIKQRKFENEKLAIEAKMIEKSIEDYRKRIPQTLTELHELISAEAAEKDVINELEEQSSNYASTIESLREEEMRLTMEIVSQEEVDRLLSSKEALTNAIAEQEALESETYAKNQERSATLVKLQGIVNSIDNAMDINPPSLLKSQKEYRSQYKELESKVADITRKKECMEKNYEKLVEDMQNLEKESALKEQYLKDMKIKDVKTNEELKALLESTENSLPQLENECCILEKDLAVEKDVTDFILKSTSTLVKNVLDNCV